MENLDNYVIKRRLAAALFGDVMLCQHKPTGDHVAVKRLLLSAATKKRTLVGKKRVRENIALERALYHRFREIGNHPNVLALRDEIEYDGYLYMVFDYCSKGDLYEMVAKTDDGRLPVATARKYMTQIVHGVQFMHENGYAHRDLSLENVLVTEEDVCKVCDLGLVASTATRSTETVGKLLYMAPEVLAGESYDVTKADVWSLGVMLFIMLLGAPPVEAATATDVRFKIIHTRGVANLIERWNLLSSIPSEAMDLLVNMLLVDPRNRFTMNQVMNHPFVSQGTSSTVLHTTTIPSTPIPSTSSHPRKRIAEESSDPTTSFVKELASTFHQVFGHTSKRRVMAISSQSQQTPKKSCIRAPVLAQSSYLFNSFCPAFFLHK